MPVNDKAVRRKNSPGKRNDTEAPDPKDAAGTLDDQWPDNPAPNAPASNDELDDLLIGKQLDDYKIIRVIGRGGMARVYEAMDVQLDRSVAVKVMSADYLGDAEMKTRFEREAKAVARLDHPNIVTVYRRSETRGLYYIAMKLLRGKTLLTVLKKMRTNREHMAINDVLRVAEDICAALDYAHGQKVIHRDIKPSNIMLTDEGRAVLMDFGLTMLIEGGEKTIEQTLGTAFGTPRYISPEQAIASQSAIPQSDIYSFGVVLYEMLTGQPPFDEGSPMNLALNHIHNPPPPARSLRPELSPAVEAVLMRALEKAPEKRWQTGKAFSDALHAAFGNVRVPAMLSPDLIDGPVPLVRPEDLAPSRPPVSLPGTGDQGKKAETKGEALPRPMPALATDSTAIMPTPKPQDTSKESRPRPAGTPDEGSARRRGLVTSTNPVVRRSERLLFGLITVTMIGLVGLALVALAPQFSAIPVGLVTTPGSWREADLRLIYDQNMFVIYNVSQRQISLEGVSFARVDTTAKFEAASFGETAHQNLAPGKCLGITDQQNSATPVFPEVCGPTSDWRARPLIRRVNFWVDNDTRQTVPFLVGQGAETLMICPAKANTCEVDLP